jgi:hypothetical protein
VIKAKDGWWYAYGTTDPLNEGEGTRHIIPTARSADLVNWTYVGDAFTEATLPDWATPDAALWAPDIRYLDGTYYLYYVVTQTTVFPGPNDNAIGVATSDSPTGPWTDSGDPVVDPRPGASGNPDDFKWTFDPSEFTDIDGTRYLYYGSYYGGIFVTELSDDGTEAVGRADPGGHRQPLRGRLRRPPRPLVLPVRLRGQLLRRPDHRLHGVRRPLDQPAGAVHRPRRHLPADLAGRAAPSWSPPTATPGSGTGHNAVATDLAGQDWLVYHAIDRRDPFLDEPFGINQRPDAARPPRLGRRLADGQGRRWASEGPQPAPVTDWAVSGAFEPGRRPASCEPLSR